MQRNGQIVGTTSKNPIFITQNARSISATSGTTFSSTLSDMSKDRKNLFQKLLEKIWSYYLVKHFIAAGIGIIAVKVIAHFQKGPFDMTWLDTLYYVIIPVMLLLYASYLSVKQELRKSEHSSTQKRKTYEEMIEKLAQEVQTQRELIVELAELSYESIGEADSALHTLFMRETKGLSSSIDSIVNLLTKVPGVKKSFEELSPFQENLLKENHQIMVKKMKEINTKWETFAEKIDRDTKRGI